MLRRACRGIWTAERYLNQRATCSWQSTHGCGKQLQRFDQKDGENTMCRTFYTSTARFRDASYTLPADDTVVAIVQSLMNKRDVLMQKQDVHVNGEIARELSELDELHERWTEWQTMQKTAASLERMKDPSVESDADMRKMASDDVEELYGQLDVLRSSIRSSILPHDPTDEQSVIMEIRPGVGGDESALFTAQVARMYSRFCEAFQRDHGQKGFEVEQLSVTPIDLSASGVDGFKEVILSVQGKGAYGLLRYEGGVHRVQRIPVTVSVPKLQTSAIAVIVLPSGDEVGGGAKDRSLDIVDPKDVKEEVMRSRGAGGQHVNKTESAVRLTHEPTGISVSMQDSRSQHQNRTKAWQVLRARLLDRKMREDQAQERSIRRTQVASTDRTDRIRTYNFPQDRVTDHRVPISTNGIDQIMEGDASDDSGLLYLINTLKHQHEEMALQTLKEQIDRDIVQLAKDSS